jgi:dynein assembly factor 5
MDSYEEFLLTVRRDINCLSEADRMTRKKAIERLQKSLLSGAKVQQEFVVKLFIEELHKPLIRMFADQAEKCRELSLAMAPQFIDMLSMADLENVLPLLLAGLLGRLRNTPFPEPSEELRLEVLRFLSHLVDVGKERLAPFTSDIVDALAKASNDTCPDAKKECCEIVKKVSACFDGERLARAGGPLVAALLGNLRHQQWKVRRATLDSLGVLLSLEAPMLTHMEEALPHLVAPNALLNDRNVAVRQCLAEVLERWLLKGLSFKAPLVSVVEYDSEPAGFDKYEHRLLLLLLTTVADEDTEQVAPLAFGGLERVASAKHEARVKALKYAKEKGAKMKAANANNPQAADEDSPVVPTEEEIEIVPEFDYSAVKNLLPAPFTPNSLPHPKTTTCVKLHLQTVLPHIFSSMIGWTADIRTSAARLMRVVLVLANRQIAPFLDQVLVHLYKASADDEQAVAKSALECAEMLGAFVEVDLILGLVAKHLGLKLVDSKVETKGQQGESVEDLFPEKRTGRTTQRTVQDVTSGVKNFTALSIENKRQVLSVLAHLLRPAAPGSPARLKIEDVRVVLRFLEECGSGEDLLPWVLGATRSLLDTGGEICVNEWSRIFDLLLRMRSTEDCDANAVDSCMDFLADLCGRTRRQLYEEHLRGRLGDLLAGADLELWEERSPKRHVLETLLRNSGPAVADHLAALAPVLARQASPEDASIPARIDLLGLVHFLVTEGDPAVIEALHEHSAAFLEAVLIPNCVWRPGQSNNKIRKGGMVCIHAMMKQHLVSPTVLNAAFSDLLPILKSCLDDSWSPDNRMIACLVLACLLQEMQAEITAEQLREVYPEMLKRLDDSNDKIRTVVCEALSVFFKCLPPKWSRTLYEYILRTLFVHLDDPNPEIQQGIYGVLEAAVHQDYAAFIGEAKAAAAKSSHPRMCEELLRLSQSLQQASLDAEFGSSDAGYPAATD